ncbi:hypothetical protein [uncultured Acetobacteroides sp.]|uniref:hypothetical protein n=1 Tax=uncultured Acetobacteroides sp. TaxID=1760811 RepID=UPI0029F4E026|nr:hypothetical protein [uncultured Acetobacteroides sp.]
MKKASLIFLLVPFLTIHSYAQSNTAPLPDGNTKIGGHLWAGAGNEVWTDAKDLYFNFRGSSAITYFWNLQGSTGHPVVSIFKDDRVGIGTSSPFAQLDINGLQGTVDTRTFRVKYFQNDNQYVGGAELSGIAHVRGRWTALYTAQGNASSAAFFDGNVGIGTESPTSKLDILQSSNTDWGAQIVNNGGQGKGLRIRCASGDITPIAQMEDNYGNVRMVVQSKGNIGIGTSTPQNLLDVNGTIRAKEVKVESGWADFVFKPDYQLKPLSEVEQFITTNGHLPEVPTAKEVEQNGVNLGEMNAKLLQKVEELTLYLIEQKKEIELLKQKLADKSSKE